MRSFLNSFACAARGIIHTVQNERNMRIHCVMVLYVLFFSVIANFSRIEYAVLSVLFAIVMTAEMFNTAIERLSDHIDAGYSSVVKVVKDIAGGAVLISAIASAAAGAALFFQPARVSFVLAVLLAHPLWVVILLISPVFSTLFIIKGVPQRK